MKVIRFNENVKLTDIQVKELLDQMKFHYEKANEIDDQLSEICKERTQYLIDDHKLKEAKDYIIKFFKGYEDYSINRDLIIASLNRQIANEIKYNL